MSILSNIWSVSISTFELQKIGELIYKNETGSKKDNLIVWNFGEEFPSLGIGHFIWYPEGFTGPFDESFPRLKEEFKKNNLEIPEIFRSNYAPWSNREDFLDLKAKNDPKILEGIKFLENTKDIQIKFIYQRLENSLSLMLEATNEKEKVKENFYRIINEPLGLYPLIDYVNFKGEGIKESERYAGYGWGLLQVLEYMSNDIKNPIEDFSNGAKYVLARRVGNSPKARGEVRWIPGWFARIDTYKFESTDFSK